MKCPHCNYIHGWDNDSLTNVNGSSGDFYSLSNEVKAERDAHSYHIRKEIAYVFACPSCRKLFIEE